MSRSLLLLLGLFGTVFLSIQTTEATGDRKVVVCYFSSWAVYRYGDGQFDVENIDPYICSHLVYAFAGLQSYDNTIFIMDPYNDIYDNWGRGAYERFTGLKKINPLLKTTLGVGGWNEGSEKYSKMAADPAKRKSFIDSTLALLLKYNFDGLDMDWEYPANRGGVPEDKVNYIILLRELKAAFEPHGLILTAAVSAGKSTDDTAYDIPEMSKYLDYIHLMTYDYHGAWDPYTGHNSPLFVGPQDSGDNVYFNINYTVNYWLQHGAPKEKLVMGMPTFGRGFVLADSSQTGLYAPAYVGIPAGPYTQEAGIWGYNEICEKALSMDKSEWIEVRDPYVKAPYMYNPSNNWWLGWDDRESIQIKVDFIKSHDLAGGMIWSIETDDFHGKCHGDKYPLLTTINLGLNGDIIKPTHPPTTTTTRDPSAPTLPTTNPTTTAAPPPDGICQKEGLVADPNDCTIFYQCVADGDKWIAYQYKCDDGTVFDPAVNACSWPYLVPGCENALNGRLMQSRNFAIAKSPKRNEGR